MAKANLSQYRGRLTPAQVADGMNSAIRNARRLADDARALFDLERYPTAASLAVLSIEESGKVSILRHFAIARDLPTCRRIWRDYRNHRSKNVAWILPDLIAAGARDLDSLQLAMQPDAEHTAILNNVKQIGLYSDCLGSVHWSEPEKVINKQLAQMLVRIAVLFCGKGISHSRGDGALDRAPRTRLWGLTGNHEGSADQLVPRDERSRSLERGRHAREGIRHGDRSSIGGSVQGIGGTRYLNDKLIEAFDAINDRLGPGPIQFGPAAQAAAWRSSSAFRSPFYTTRWEDIPKVKT